VLLHPQVTFPQARGYMLTTSAGKLGGAALWCAPQTCRVGVALRSTHMAVRRSILQAVNIATLRHA
jgi:hypothetical protein